MKGLVFLGEGKMEFRDFPDPTPGPDEVVVRVKSSGMCGSDLNHLNEPRRREDQIVIEGHEPCGIIEEVGSAVRPWEARVGDRVMVYHYDGCRTCSNCRTGWMQNCDHTRIAFGGNGHGAHAPFMKVPAHTIIKLPEQLSFNAGAAVGCGSGTAYAALKRVNLLADETIAIFGQGPVGLSCTVFAKAFGARVIALDVGEERLEMAQKFGADFVINPMKDDPVQAIRDLTRAALVPIRRLNAVPMPLPAIKHCRPSSNGALPAWSESMARCSSNATNSSPSRRTSSAPSLSTKTSKTNVQGLSLNEGSTWIPSSLISSSWRTPLKRTLSSSNERSAKASSYLTSLASVATGQRLVA